MNTNYVIAYLVPVECAMTMIQETNATIAIGKYNHQQVEQSLRALSYSVIYYQATPKGVS